MDARAKTFRSASELVTTAVTVRDAEGRLVTSLEQKDFIVEEDGVPQPITQFTKERVPVSLSLTLDISDSMRGERMVDARTALSHFLDKLLAVEDEAALVGFNHEARLYGAWTIERAGMRGRLDGITPSGGTAMYDAIDVSLPLFDSRQHPRAAILLVSDGADTASDTTPTILKQKLNRSDVFLYAIGIDSLDARNSTRINPYHPAGADQPGRRLHRNHPLDRRARAGDRAHRRRAEQSVLIGYTPAKRGDGKYHTIRVKTTNDTYRVRARRGVVR